MRTKIILLFYCLTLTTAGFCQKIILIRDSTALRQYFGRQVTRVLSGTDQKEVSRIETVISTQSPINRPNSSHDGLNGGPVMHAIKNEHSLFLNKKIKSELQNVDIGLVPTSYKINYRAYSNESGLIDSLVYFISSRDINQTVNANVLLREKLLHSIDTKLKHPLNQAFSKAISSFSLISPQLGANHLNGYFMLNFEKKDLETYLSSVTDTISSIYLAGFGLRQLPPELKRFRNLRSIDLNDNFIEHVSINKKDFPKLRTLSLQNNILQDKHLIIKRGVTIEKLNLNNNYFSKIPKTNRNVKQLLLANNNINRVSKGEVKKIKNLESLNLYANEISSISPHIYKIKKLKEIDLYRNNLSYLLEKFTRLKNLESLAISHNQLINLPKSISQMKSLKTLYVHHNKLLELPDLPVNLETLDIGYNRLEAIGNSVKPLKSLRVLDYSNNFVNGDLDFLLALPEIKEIYLFENKYASTDDQEKYFGNILYKLLSKGIKVK